MPSNLIASEWVPALLVAFGSALGLYERSMPAQKLYRQCDMRLRRTNEREKLHIHYADASAKAELRFRNRYTNLYTCIQE